MNIDINSNLASLKSIIKSVPHKPGVYRYYDSSKNLLYIGKAKDLKNRVSSYFQESGDMSTRIRLMVSQINSIEYSVVNTDKEAILMEANLIHSLQPRYNILLKDDKSYSYVRVSRDIIPSVTLTRRKYDPNSRYFGPFTRQFAITEALRTLRIIFPFCLEKNIGDKPCNYVSIKQCEGVCCGWEDIEVYNQRMEQLVNVLSGRVDVAAEWIQQRMIEAVDKNNFALASLWRDKITLLKDIISDQKVVLPHPQDIDIVTLVTKYDTEGLQFGSIYLQNIRAGKITNVNNFLMTGTEVIDDPEDGELQLQFLSRFLASYKAGMDEDIPILLEVF